MGLFISYDNATKQLDTVYDLTPELARAFLERIGASDFDLRNTSTVHRQAGLGPGSGAPGHCPGQPPLSSPQREGRRPAPLFDQSPASVPERGGVFSKRPLLRGSEVGGGNTRIPGVPCVPGFQL